MTGPIPDELGNLEELTVLYLDGSQLTGPIPRRIGDLPLQWLSLANNQLSGPIPPGIGNLKRLAVLRLGPPSLKMRTGA